jgi:tetrahydromethanopterin S-methyltransferase subunit G
VKRANHTSRPPASQWGRTAFFRRRFYGANCPRAGIAGRPPRGYTRRQTGVPSSIPQDRRIADLAEDLQAAQDRIADLQKRLDEVEQRLGETYRPISPFDTVERRLEDLEKDVEDIQRR